MKPFAALPSLCGVAVIIGKPSEPVPFMIRVKLPRGVKLMPHRHPKDRIYTGIFSIGLGDKFEADKLAPYSSGIVIVLRGNTSHFHWAKSGDYIAQVRAIGAAGR